MLEQRCVNCFIKNYNQLFDKFNFHQLQSADFINYIKKTINDNEFASSPEIQAILQKKFCEIVGKKDLYEEEKKQCNEIALNLYREWAPKVRESENPFKLALRLAIAGNIMDYGANNSFNIFKTIEYVLNTEFAIDKSLQLEEKIKKAKKILYLGDNAGEIVFDRLFLEIINHKNVYYAVKDAAILNDVTYKDAITSGINKTAKIISNGFNAPSTILSRCSDEFIDIYNSSDLIISKGQGNLEGLVKEKDSRIFFLLMVKCDVIAEILDVKKNSIVVMNMT